MPANIAEFYSLSTAEFYTLWSQTGGMDYTQRTALERIQEAMRDKGLSPTQQSIATTFGMTQPSVHAWQTGTPELTRAIEIGKQLNVCVEWILTGRGPKRPGPPMEIKARKLWDLWGRVPDEGRSELIGHAEARATPSRPASSRLRSNRARLNDSSSEAP